MVKRNTPPVTVALPPSVRPLLDENEELNTLCVAEVLPTEKIVWIAEELSEVFIQPSMVNALLPLWKTELALIVTLSLLPSKDRTGRVALVFVKLSKATPSKSTTRVAPTVFAFSPSDAVKVMVFSDDVP